MAGLSLTAASAGSSIALARAGHDDEIAAYCLGDVIVTFSLMLRFAFSPALGRMCCNELKILYTFAS